MAAALAPQGVGPAGPSRYAPAATPPTGAPAATPPGNAVPANSPLLNPNQPLSGPSLQQAAQGLADAQTVGPLTELAKAIAANNAQTAGAEQATSQYFNQLGGFANQGFRDESANARSLNQQLTGIDRQTLGQLQGIGGAQRGMLLRYAPQGSGGLDRSALQSLAQEIARQQGLAAQEQGSFRAFGANQGANYKGLAASNLGTFALGGQEALRNIAQAGQLRNEPLNAKVAGLDASRGALYSTALGKLRQQEINNGIARQGLGIKEQSAQLTAAQDAAKNALAARGQDIAQQNDLSSHLDRVAALNEKTHNDAANVAIRQAAQNLKNNTGGTKPLTQQSQNGWYSLLGRVEGLIRQGQSANQSEAQIRQFLQSGLNPTKRSYDPVMIEAAYELLGWGALLPKTARAMHEMGLRGGTYNGQPIRVQARPQRAPFSPGSIGTGSGTITGG